ncbi:MAG: ribulose-phosphate 3-epimerase [Erysipelotrichaceae bacterium]
MTKILPSIASADQLNVQNELNKIKGTPYLHIDIEDGNFIPNITFGLKMIESIVHNNQFYYDIHLLVTNPLSYLNDLLELNIHAVSFHIEACEYPLQILNKLRKNNVKAGVAFNFKTPIETIIPFIQSIDYILIMTSEPDDGSNFFNTEILKKISHARKILPNNIEIWVDGGISEKHLPLVTNAGADTVVMGRAVWKSANPTESINIYTNL